jgi:rifampin ADP-ribosylating transferase
MTTDNVLDRGPFLHGTKAVLQLGDCLKPQHHSNYEVGRISNYIYFTGTLEAAKWGAELATGSGKERIYLVEPLGEFERFPGNPTRSYRSKEPLKIIGELATWERHADEMIAQTKAHLKQMQADGTAEIID